MKISNLRITPKLGILVVVAMAGLLVAGLFAASILQREMRTDRFEQTKSIVETAVNMAVGLQKQVDAGQMTKDAAIAEFQRRAQSMTYDGANGYLLQQFYSAASNLRDDEWGGNREKRMAFPLAVARAVAGEGGR